VTDRIATLTTGDRYPLNNNFERLVIMENGSICIFLGEDSDTWKRPIPEDKTIHVNVFIDPETGEIEYFRHNMPFHMQLHINHSEAEDISPDGTIAVDEDEDEEWQTIPEKTYDVDYGDNIMSESD
tara:strand:+ start:169 stop:546 length:378 start_codon:yes stop_codon:yes gene_type:complete